MNFVLSAKQLVQGILVCIASNKTINQDPYPHATSKQITVLSEQLCGMETTTMRERIFETWAFIWEPRCCKPFRLGEKKLHSGGHG